MACWLPVFRCPSAVQRRRESPNSRAWDTGAVGSVQSAVGRGEAAFTPTVTLPAARPAALASIRTLPASLVAWEIPLDVLNFHYYFI